MRDQNSIAQISNLSNRASSTRLDFSDSSSKESRKNEPALSEELTDRHSTDNQPHISVEEEAARLMKDIMRTSDQNTFHS